MEEPTVDIDMLLEHVEATIQNVYAVGDALRDEAEASRDRGNREASSALDEVAEHVEDSSFRWNALALLLRRIRRGEVRWPDLEDGEVWEKTTEEVELVHRGPLSRRMGGPGVT